jgi:hypothetical protein
VICVTLFPAIQNWALNTYEDSKQAVRAGREYLIEHCSGKTLLWKQLNTAV